MRNGLWVAAALAAAAPAQGAVLLSAEPISGAPEGASAFRIRYRSTGFDGRPQVVTGMLIEPRGRAPAEGRPIVAWAHGTVGISESCVLSGALQSRFRQIAGLDPMLRRGWVVVAPDYAGLGSRGPHPYLVADATAAAVSDAVLAAAERSPASRSIHYAVWGQSQGGHAALATAAKRMLAGAGPATPRLRLVGAAAAAPPTDLAANFSARINPTTKGVLTAFVAASWAEGYGADLRTLGPPNVGRLIGRMAKLCALEPGNKLGQLIGAVALGQALKRVEVPATAPWKGLLRRNSIDPRAAAQSGPLLIAQGTKDDLVSPAVTRRFAMRACAAGARLRFVPIAGGDHNTAAERSAEQTVEWLADRFAGERAPSDCGRL